MHSWGRGGERNQERKGGWEDTGLDVQFQNAVAGVQLLCFAVYLLKSLVLYLLQLTDCIGRFSEGAEGTRSCGPLFQVGIFFHMVMHPTPQG